MAGLSSRFAAAGYKKPKYYLEIGEMTLFQASLKGFSEYFTSDGFCFIYLEKFIDEQTIRDWAEEIGLPRSNCLTVPLSSPTKGQAETVLYGVEAASGLSDEAENVTIFNIDTIYHDFRKPDYGPANYLDVTNLKGSQWSFVDPDPNQPDKARRVVEKERISNLCSVGLYGFRSSQTFYHNYTSLYQERHSQKEEYVAPIYQKIIDGGSPVAFREFPRQRFQFVGTPEEYENYVEALNSPKLNRKHTISQKGPNRQ